MVAAWLALLPCCAKLRFLLFVPLMWLCHFLPLQDDEAELLAELERIKRERAEEAAKKAAAEAEAAEREEAARLATGNPLLQVRTTACARTWGVERVGSGAEGWRRCWLL